MAESSALNASKSADKTPYEAISSTDEGIEVFVEEVDAAEFGEVKDLK